jgi:hypothetical protein
MSELLTTGGRGLLARRVVDGLREHTVARNHPVTVRGTSLVRGPRTGFAESLLTRRLGLVLRALKALPLTFPERER